MLANARFGTNNLEAAKKFYDAIAEIAGAKRAMEMDNLVGWKSPGGMMLLVGKPFEGEATSGNGSQAVIQLDSRDKVHAMHAKALELGGKDEGAPGLRGDNADGFYGCYFRDLDGNKIVAFQWGGA